MGTRQAVKAEIGTEKNSDPEVLVIKSQEHPGGTMELQEELWH